MGEIQIRPEGNEIVKNAREFAKQHGIKGPFLAKALGTLGVASLSYIFLGVAGLSFASPLIWVFSSIVSFKSVDVFYALYYSRKNAFYILRPETTIIDGKLGLKTISYSELPESFFKFFEKHDSYMNMGEREFLDYYNQAVLDYYSEGGENLYRHMIDALILFPMRKKMERLKLRTNPTIEDLYYGLKYDYKKPISQSSSSYWAVIDGLGNLISPDYKEKIKELTGIEIKIPTDDKKEELKLPMPDVHKMIRRLPLDMLSFFIPEFSSYQEFSEEGASKEYFELGVADLVKQAYLSRMVLKYLGKYTDENELEFRRFIDIADEAKKNLYDNKVLVRVVEYASVIERKFEDVEKLLEEYSASPGKFSDRNSELLQLKLDSLIMQSKKDESKNNEE